MDKINIQTDLSDKILILSGSKNLISALKQRLFHGFQNIYSDTCLTTLTLIFHKVKAQGNLFPFCILQSQPFGSGTK